MARCPLTGGRREQDEPVRRRCHCGLGVAIARNALEGILDGPSPSRQPAQTSLTHPNARWQKKCDPLGAMMKVCASLLLVLLLATACSTTRPPQVVRFTEQDKASLIVRYYTDETSYVLKPATTEGPFLSILKQDAVLDVAKQQPDRELAVVILIHYGCQNEIEAVRHKWTNLLMGLGYERVVFLAASGSMRVNGLPVLD